MSLEAKLAALSIDDVTSVVDTVKAEGVEKSGLASNISVLAARCGSKDETEAVAALKTAKALAEGVPSGQAFYKECLAACKYHPRPFWTKLIFKNTIETPIGLPIRSFIWSLVRYNTESNMVLSSGFSVRIRL
jgi:hypothetical protein